MRQSIRGYADAVIEDVGHSEPRTDQAGLQALAGELAAVRDVIAGSEDLQRVLVDPGVPIPARRGLINDLFGGRVGEATMRLLRRVITAERISDTVSTIGSLSIVVDAAARDLESVGDAVLGIKAAEERVDGYATAVLEGLDRERGLGEVEDELFRFLRVVGGSEKLSTALSSREVPSGQRRQVVIDLLESKATPETTRLAVYATHVGRPRDYEDLLDFLVAKVAAESNRRLAEVRAAMELDDTQRRNLAAALGEAVGHDVDIRVTVDPAVVGGFVATIGDTVIDGSARRQLELLRDRLVTPDLRIRPSADGAGTAPQPNRSGPRSNSPDSTNSDTGERH